MNAKLQYYISNQNLSLALNFIKFKWNGKESAF
jgi:hypothetical protein